MFRHSIIPILLVSFASLSMQVKKKKIVFFGDSITEAAVQPSGYISRLNEYLNQRNLSGSYELVGAGVSGNKVYDLYLRIEEDVINKQPDAVVIWIGVNDVWHKKGSGTGTDADKFERFYNALIKKLQDKQIKVYLCTPAAIGEKTDYTNELDGDLNKYAAIIRTIATNNKCELIDLRKAFLDYNLQNNSQNAASGILTNDGVHLNEKGNSFVAEQMSKVIFR
jgi:lysophospholipase L1-like esterase